MLLARGTARDEAQKLHRKWLKHRAFMVELACNKEWLAKIELEGQELIQEQPELRSVVQQKLEEIRECWSELENTTKAQARQLFEHKPELEVKSYSELDHQLSHLEQQPPQLEQTPYLPTVSEQLQKTKVMESQMGDFFKDVGQLGSFQGACLPELRVGAGEAEGEELEARVETRIVRLIEPLKERRRILLASKEMHQVAQDLEDEMLWIQERLPLATSKDPGTSFHSVQQQAKANQKLQREVASRRARLAEVLDRAGMIASLRTPEVDFVREGAEHVHQLWEVLQTETERRSAVLSAALQAQQYYGQAAKVEAWLADQKLQLATDDKGLDEVSTLQLLKGHQAVEQTVEAYTESVGLLSQQCQHLLEIGHPESEQIMKQQSHIDRLYLSVKDMVEHRKTKLEQQYWLYQLHKDVEELDKWITEREVVASSTELGQDLEDVTVLQETFSQFVCETNSLGQQRLEQVNKLANEMIKCGHSDAAAVAEWKDGLNESWADLLELMETRTQMLAASQQLHRFFTDCKEVLAQIAGKMQQLPELHRCQASSSNAAALQRLLLAYEHGLQLLVAQVRQLQENATQLRTIYAGEKAEAILGQEEEVLEAWRQLLNCCEASHVQVTSVTDKVQFFSVVRENLMWMEGIMGQIGWDEPRDLAALETMIKQHRELKGKIDGRSKTIQQCADLGKILIAAGDSASEEIKEKLDSLLVKQRDLLEKWGKHEEKLQKKQERFHFVQETVQAEVWLKAKEPLITSSEPERGEAQSQKDEVEQLILRHQAFRKAAVTWKERFSSLRQLSATEKKQEEVSSKSFSSQRMLPFSCLSASVPSSSSSSLFLRHAAQAHEAKTNFDLSAASATQRLCSSPASYNTVRNPSGYPGLEQHCSGKAVSSKQVGKNPEAAAGGGDTAFSLVTSHRDGVDPSSYLTVNLPRTGSVESSRDFGLRMQNHLGDGRLEGSETLLQPSSSAAAIPSYLHQQNMASSAYFVQPQSLRCSAYGEQQSSLGDPGSFTQHHNVVDSGYLGQTYPSGGGTGSNDYLPHSQCSSGLASSAYLARSGGMSEPRIAYPWQNLKSDFTQPRINNTHKAVNPLLEGRTMQGQHCGQSPPATRRGPETGLELLHGRLQRDPRGSRSDPQMDHLRQEREYKLGRQTSSEQEIQARLNELPMIVRQERYRRHLERQSSSEKEGSNKQRLQRQDSSDLEASVQTGPDKYTGEKRSTMAEIVEQVQEREAAHARGETYRPSSSLSAPVTRFDGRPRARDRPKPRRRPRPKEPEEARRSRSAPATGAPTTPQPPSHAAQNEGFLYRKKATTSDLEGQQRSPNSKSWVNIYCVLKEGKLTFYKDARNHNTTYNEEPPVDLSTCSFDPSMGYKKKKNVFILQTDDGNFFAFHAKDEEDLKAWTSNITICIAEHKAMKKWDKPDVSSLDPEHSERKEKSEGDADARSERSEQALGDERSDRGDRSEKLDTSEIADRMEGGAGESSTSLKSK